MAGSILFDSQFLDSNGDPLASGELYFYVAGTTTAKSVYPTKADAEAGTNALANPVVLNSAGRASTGQVWLSGEYKVVLKDSGGSTIWTIDEVGDASDENALPEGYSNGLTVSLDTAGGDTDHDVNVAAGEARDGADSVDMALSSEITKKIDATWAVGDDAGGLDTGSVAASTTYYVWLIKRTDTGVVDVLISASSSAPTLPTNYDKKRLIGLGATDTDSNWSYVRGVNRNLQITSAGNLDLAGDGTGLTLSAGESFVYDGENVVADAYDSRANIIVNGDGMITVESSAAISDDTYGLHGVWYALTQSNDITPTTQSDAGDGTPYLIRINQDNASAQRMGYAQIIEGCDCKHLRGQPVALHGKVKPSVTSDIRYAILEWTGTEDSVTSDVVNDWTSASYTAGGFFISSNITVRAVGAMAAVSASLADLTTLTTTLGSTFNNLVVIIWTEDMANQNEKLDFRLALTPGATARPWMHTKKQEELSRVNRYVCVFAPANVDTLGMGFWGSSTALKLHQSFPVPMRAQPSLTVSSASHFAVNEAGTANIALTGLSLGSESTTEHAWMDGTVSSSTAVAGEATYLLGNNASAKLTFSARL